MNSLLSPGYFSSCSSESDNESSSDSDENYPNKNAIDSTDANQIVSSQRKSKSVNLITKLLNREQTGCFTNNILHKNKMVAFNKIPKRLSFCLKEIVPYCYLTGHVFMGLTVCGQFLLSYKVVCDEDSAESNYNFSSTYRYELFFWIYRPHNLLCKYYNVCLFDDHGVDSLKVVSMAQWHSNPRILVVHGDGKFENEDSYATMVAVPKLGCLDCRKLRDDFYADTFDPVRCAVMCLQCNLTIHTKYCRSETDPKFNPKINLICNDKIVIVTSGLIHMMQICLDLNRPIKPYTNSIDIKYIRPSNKTDKISNANENAESVTAPVDNLIVADACKLSVPLQIICPDSAGMPLDGPSSDKNANRDRDSNANVKKQQPPKTENIVERIIADFAECETEYPSTEKLFQRPNTSNFNELVITCGANNIPTGAQNSNKVRLLNHRSNRIISKSINSMKNGITKIDLQLNNGQMNSNKNLDKAAKAYEFSEDNEKCEKISIFRKRRLADKKYEFSEDNSENIIPYNKLRSAIRNFPSYTKIPKSSPGHSSCFNSSSPTSFDIHSPHHTHRASPSYGFRSPCGSPVSNRFMMMSPPGRSYFYAKSPTYVKQSSMSPRTQTTKRSYIDSSNFDHSANMLPSPRSDDYEGIKMVPSVLSTIQPLSEVKPSNIDVKSNHSIQCSTSQKSDCEIEKPICSIKLIRRYVEEDDATSVITSEEDDCISPGYHTSLPLEVHGSSYSEMQMVSKTTYDKLVCPTIIVTQNTFDLEAFTYYAANYVCSMNSKRYGFFLDCACEIIKICPLSCNITCILMLHFTARDIQPPNTVKPCVNCTSTQNLDCVFHRKHYECRILFTWDIDTGEWNVQDYGELLEVPPIHGYGRNSSELHRTVKKLATELIGSLGEQPDLFNNVRVLDCCNEKSKEVLKDLDNSIEFYRSSNSRPYDNNYTYSSDVSDIE